MSDAPSTRLGIARPPQASPQPIVAEIEARVLVAELTRRMGRVVLDLRTDGDEVGPWQPLAHAAWPGAVDAVLDVAPLWSAAAPLTALMGRTIEPAAAEVRARMLVHLGLVPTAPYTLDAERLAELTALAVRPTDLWLIADRARSVLTGNAAIDGLATPSSSPGVEALDDALDRLANGVAPGGPSVAHLQAELAAVRARVTELEADAQRTAGEAAARLDELTAERAVLVERLERAQIDIAVAG